ncbi:MAG: tricarboxylate transporter [Alphaproteobacteria bacterium]|nr:MAG: tricarboxylate transporter [Alphaproteobacteria bacterium]
MEDAVLSAIVTLLSPSHLAFLSLGVVLGLVVGILPGLGGTAGLALVLPFVFGMEASHAIAVMIGLQSVTATSDTFPAVLMGIPGTSGSQATVMDGFPMSKRGEGARALSAAFTSSLFGGLFGAAVLSVAIFFAEPLIMAIGLSEQLMLVVLALAMVGTLTGISPAKGMAACCIGLMIGAFGSAPGTGEVRLTFDTEYLLDPVQIVIMGLAMFAIPEIIELVRRGKTISETGKLGSGWLIGMRDWARNWGLSLRCAAIGCLVGALPGLGGTVIDWIAYSHAIQTTSNRESYGTGDVRGVIAPESANNAKEGGALIPTILFGIPGSGGMAILLGGFILVGIEPGFEMITTQLDLVYIMIWSIAIANIAGAGTCLILAPQIAKLTTIRYALLAPFMLGLIFFAAFQATRDWGDLIALLALGTLGVYMKRFGWPRPALLIGFVLAGKVESSINETVSIYGFSFLQRPIVIALLILTIIAVVAALRLKPSQPKLTEDGVHTNRDRTPQVVFFFAVVGFALLILWDSLQHDFQTALFPRVVATIGLFFMAPVGFHLLTKTNPHTVFYDSKWTEENVAAEHGTNEYYLGWLVAMLGVSALVGFVLGIAIFIYAFMRLRARSSHMYCTIGAVSFVLFLGVLSHFLVLQYPLGFLQDYVDLPWPLQ